MLRKKALANKAVAAAVAAAKKDQDVLNLAIANAKVSVEKAAAASENAIQQEWAAARVTTVTPNVKTLANKVEEKISAQLEKEAPVTPYLFWSNPTSQYRKW